MSRLKVGLDHGTASLKLALSNEKEGIMPNVIGEPPSIDWATRELRAPPLIEAMEAKVADCGPQYVGAAALSQCRAKHYVVEEGQIVNPKRALTTSLSLLACLMSETKVSRLEVDVALGVPVRTSAQVMQHLEERLAGPHSVRLRHIPTGQTFDMSVDVKNVKTLPKPYGAIFALEMDQRYSQFKDETFCGFIIDIGQGSTDILAVDQAKIILPASTTSNAAIDVFLNDLANLLTEKYGINVDSEDLGLAAEQDILNIFGRQIDLRADKDRLARDVAQQIFAVVSRCLRALPIGSNATHRILLTGGGSYLFGPYLKTMLEARGYRNAFQPPDPLAINARGLVQYGELAWPT